MTWSLAIVLILLVAAVLMFAANRPRMDVVALLMLTVLPLTGVITMAEALNGFSDSNIVLIAALFVIGEGLVRTGVAQRLGDWLIARAGDSQTRMLALLMLVVTTLGSVMSSTGVVAIFIPIVLRIAQNTATPPSQLMMPLSVAALISGMTTLVATAPNLVVNSELVRHGETGFHFFSFTPFGVPILFLGIAYMIFARRWLAADQPGGGAGNGRPNLQEWIDRYGLAAREYRLRIGSGSPLIGKTLQDFELRSSSGVNILAIERSGNLGEINMRPIATRELQEGDCLLVDLSRPGVDMAALRQDFRLEELPLSGTYFLDQAQEIGMAEIVVPAESSLIGKTVIEANFRSHYGLTLVGLRRGSHALETGLIEERLRTGDILLVVGAWSDIRRLQDERDDLFVLNLPAELETVLPAASRAPQALFCLALVVVLMVTGLVPNVQAALIGCLLMGALGCIDMESAYRSINWQSLVLIVGMLPFSTALQRTGGVDLAADAMLAAVGSSGIHVVLGSLFFVTAALGLFISNTATAVLMAPVALAMATDLHASPYPFAMTVALAASAAFMTPVSSPVNTLVVTPGNYGFSDFVRVGVPFTIIVLFVCVLLVPWLMPP